MEAETTRASFADAGCKTREAELQSSSAAYGWNVDGKATRMLTWDARGNITGISKDGYSNTYYYDSLNRLVQEQDGNPVDISSKTAAQYGAAYSDVGGRKALDISLADSTVKFDYYSSSVGMNLLAERKINKIELTGKSSRLNKRTVEVYASTDGSDGTWKKVPDITFVPTRDGTTLLFAEPVEAQYLKVHSTYDERDKAYKPVDNSTVGGTPAQLVEVYYSADGEDISWTFDARGNRLTETKYEGGSSTGNITLEYYANSDLIKTRGSWQFNYDKNGNMLSRGTAGTWNGSSYDWAADKGELWEYGYDLSNRLISVKKSAAGTDGLKAKASYAYDIRGLRVESVKDSSTTYYQYGLSGELLWSDDGSTQEKYVYANAKIWAEVRTTGGENATYYHHVDHLGTTETITDAAGTVVWDASYEAYGKLVHENGTVSFKASFTGKQVDSDTGLYYFNARWYDAELGRFVTEDPARDGSNWYEYCKNNPLIYTDHTGLIVWGIDSAYKMQDYSGIIPHNGGSMTLHGCAITLEANVLYSNGNSSITPNIIRSNSSNFGDGGGILFANAASESGLSTSNSKISGRLTASHYNELVADNNTGYYIGIEVNYDGVAEHHHWVGVNGISGDNYIISPTSVNDSATGAGSLRGNQGWTTDSSGNILVPMTNVSAYQTFSKSIQPSSTESPKSTESSGLNILRKVWTAVVDFLGINRN